MINKLIFSIYMVSLLSIQDITCQPRTYLFESMDQYREFPDSRVILQDKDGIMWVGTHDSIWRYDGYEVSNFKYNRSDTSSLSGAAITALFEDHSSRLWVASLGGNIDRSNEHKNQFKNISLNSQLPSFRIHVFNEDDDQNIWIGGDEGLIILSYQNSAIQRSSNPFHGTVQELLKEIVVYDILFQKNGLIWLATKQGLYFCNTHTASIHKPADFGFFPDIPVYDLELNLKYQEDPTISISTAESIEFIKIRKILRCEAHGAYSEIYFNKDNKLLISKVIKELENILTDFSFFRIHQSHLVNLLKVEKYIRKENMIIMSDGTRLPLARSRKEDFFEVMNLLKYKH